MTSANSSPNPLNDDFLADVAYWRSRGLSWEDTAAKVKWEPAELRRVTRNDPDFERELAYATREYEQESEARALHSLRVQMDGSDPRAALTAAKAVLSYLSRKRVEATRREVAYLRAEEPVPGPPSRPSKAAVRPSQEPVAPGRAPTSPLPTRGPDNGPSLKPPGGKPSAVPTTSKPYDDAPPG